MDIRIYGASDDLIEFEGDIYDEFNWYGRDAWQCQLIAPNGDGLTINVRYGADDWTLDVSPLSEDGALPDWIVVKSRSEEVEYSEQLDITAPDGTELVHISHVDED
jgi:hypothetical protein